MNTSTFDESDPSTWENLPAGYRWIVVDPENGESHLFSPDGRDVTDNLT